MISPDGGMSGETVALMMAMGTYILKDLRDRVSRLESIEMQAAKEAREHP